ncbi:MAG TPA: helix-turn-helix domain-containing protein [Modestobacter sp.]|jgi:AraC-like DNA-binding protein|nr:helix-turn-helix domain-containing protein [Modestobacter sp.]
MAVLLDTAHLAPDQRVDAVHEAFTRATVPTRVRLEAPTGGVRAWMHLWQFGPGTVFTARGSGLRLTRLGQHLRGDPPRLVAVAVHERGAGLLRQGGREERVGAGEMMLTDLTDTYDFAWRGDGGSQAFQVDLAELGLPVEVVRAAAGRLGASPLHGLFRDHLLRLFADTDRLAADPGAPHLGTATVELLRALLVSAAGGDGLPHPALVADSLLGRVLGYARAHLGEADLGPARLAAAHHVSVRHLYAECARAGISLEQWLISQRLEAARRTLDQPSGPRQSVAAVAHGWGFTDAGHFSRRFREAYGLTPREWRDRRTGD